MDLILDLYKAQTQGVLNFNTRIVIAGHLHLLSYAKDMTKYLYNQQIRIYDYPDFAQPFRDLVCEFTG
jgi:hypothetical protein